MNDRPLGSLQVAALLVSASYGIGFLFGSGGLAVVHGMAGSLYGVATALGMLVLACFARRLWASGLSVWALFGRSWGPRVQGAVALLSLIWMAGVLAAQIQGGVALAYGLGLREPLAQLAVLALVYGAARLDLRFASAVFALCLLASAGVLVAALFVSDGVGLYLGALPAFVNDLSSFTPSRLVAMTLAIGLLVCTGADYHQFVLAARRPMDAVLGCALAGLALLIIGLLPAAVVVAMQQSGALAEVAHGAQVMPTVLAQVAGAIAPGAEPAMLIVLSAAALGSGAAILRAMTDALASTASGLRAAPRPLIAVVALGVGAALAWRGQDIVETMVSVNVVYLASIGVCFVALLRGRLWTAARARAVMAAGFGVSATVYAGGWAGWIGEGADIVSLVGGLAASGVAALWPATDRAERQGQASRSRR